jgi:hypothetical protein
MNNYQIAKHKSNLLVVKEAKENQTVVNLIPNFAEGIASLDVINSKIEDVSLQQSKNNKGVTNEKDNLISNFIAWLIDISGAIYFYASSIGDSILMEKVHFKKTAVDKMVLTRLLSAGAIVLEQAKLVPVDSLVKAGISAQDLIDYQSLLQTLKDSKSSTRVVIIDKSGYTEQLNILFAQAQTIVSNLDKLATQFKRKSAAFYLKYKAARLITIHSPHKVTTSVVAKPADAAK